MARIDTLNDRLKRLREMKRRINDASAQRQIDAAIKRTEKQIANAASKMGRPPRRNVRRTQGGRFG